MGGPYDETEYISTVLYDGRNSPRVLSFHVTFSKSDIKFAGNGNPVYWVV